ncbi:MAG: 2-phospho-L-lactate transferase [Pseudomonadota bacterium]
MPHVVALCGGVGGAKLAFGLAQVLPPEALTIIVNTGDDFEHLGLHISPDIDTVLYTLAGLSDPVRGWGLAGETWHFMDALGRIGGAQWFLLGDRDLATHIERTRRLRGAESLSDVTAVLARALGIAHAVVPMSDDSVRTIVGTATGEMEFQRYFVAERCAPEVTAMRFAGADAARIAPGAAAALARADLGAVIICPSNPYLSIDPILAVPGMRAALAACTAPVVAISPLVGGQAIKGPTAKLMLELGIKPGVAAIAAHYAGVAQRLVIDHADADQAPAVGLPTLVAQTVMKNDADRIDLARTVLEWAA